MQKDKIVVIGGYGKVGKSICLELASFYPGKVYAAGRSMEKAKKFCASADNRILPMKIDVTHMTSVAWLRKTALVISCLDEADDVFAKTCMENGSDYITISADRNLLARMAEIPAAKNCCVMSVGLAPGMTNLLAQHASSGIADLDSVDISVLLGLGETHGKAAIDWTIDAIASTYHVNQKLQPQLVRSFTGKRNIDLEKLGNRSAYYFPFSDQFSLPSSLGAKRVVTRLCFDNRFVTKTLALAANTGLTRLLRFSPVRSLITNILSLPFGSAVYAVKAEAKGKINGKPVDKWSMITGQEEAQITAAVTVSTAKLMLRNAMPAGQWHMDELFCITSTNHDISLQLKDDPDIEIIQTDAKWMDSANKKTTA